MKPVLTAALASAALALVLPTTAQAQSGCDRQCLIDLADSYAQALIDDNPGALRWANGEIGRAHV